MESNTEVRVTTSFCQEADTWQPTEMGSTQSLALFTEGYCSDQSDFYVLETERWAFETREELIALIDEFLGKVNRVRGVMVAQDVANV